MKKITVFILILTLILIFVFTYKVSFVFAISAMPVKVVYVKKSTIIKNITSIGMVHSTGRLIIRAPFTGKLIESFSHPKSVPSGTVIARVVSPGLYAKIISAEASVKYAKIKLKREKLLFSYGVTAKKNVELADLNLSNAYSSLKALESLNREGILVSQSNGTVHYLTANGTIVSSGSRVAVLNGKGAPWISTYVTPSHSFNMHIDMQVYIKRKRIKEKGKITSISGNAAHNGLVPVYISLPKNSSLLPGEWVNLRFAESKTRAFSLPERAVIMLKDRTVVFAVAHSKAHAVRVNVMWQKNGIAYVKGNINSKEPIIIYPVTRLVSGIPVEIKH